MAVGYMDLDRFKQVNDSYGHDVGDKLLIEVSARLKTALRSVDSISRFGGDEFALLLSDFEAVEELNELLARLLVLVAEPYHFNDIVIHVTMSLGITIYPQDDGDPDILLRHADEALYAAKAAGRNNFQIYPDRK